MSQGRLFIISGPSAVGKGTIVREIMNSSAGISLSVSATTRAPRAGEVHGEHYYFMTDDEFQEKIGRGEFLEYAQVHGHYYGTPAEPVQKKLSQGCDVILEIDVQGAMNVMKAYEHGIYIFILPPSLEELKNRIVSRGTESEESIRLRMGKAMGEMAFIDRYDYFVVNDDLEEAVKNVSAIMTASHHRVDEHAAALLDKYKIEK